MPVRRYRESAPRKTTATRKKSTASRKKKSTVTRNPLTALKRLLFR